MKVTFIENYPVFLFLVAVKATLVLAVTMIALRLASRATASTRHWICASSLGGLILLPLMAGILPEWNVTANVAVIGYAAAAMREGAGAGRSIEWSYGGVLILIWAGGCAAVLSRALGGWALIEREVGRSVRVTDAGWVEDWERIAGQNGWQASRIEIRAAKVSSALTWGVARPVILIPRETAEWTRFARNAVLLHEAAHIRRHDCLFNWMAQAACAMFWFHPLVWRVAARLRREQELACDDAVVMKGVAPAEYAGLLLESARGLRSGLLFGCGFNGEARRNELQERFAYLLDGRRKHCAARTSARWIAAPFLASLLLLCAVRPMTAEEIYKIGGDVTAPKVVTKKEPDYTAEAKKRGVNGTVHLRVVIGKNGIPRDVHVTQGLDTGLDANAVKAVKAWRFSPSERHGKAVSVRAEIEVNFRLL